MPETARSTATFLTEEDLTSRYPPLRFERTTLWRLRTRKRDPLPSHRLGGRIYYVADEVERWLRKQPRPVRIPAV